MRYVKAETVLLRGNPNFSEKWVHDRIAEDPTVLGLGDLILKDSERLQPQAGRLDLLLQDSETERRYEVEIQLGRTDEAHIIRTIEYWDIERKRYPQYEHTAVIVAEDITSRFLNVVALFNGVIPLIAIQMNAVCIGDEITLVFTKVVDQMALGLVDEDEEVREVTDRGYWERRASTQTLAVADELIALVQSLDADLEPKYNKIYIGFARNGTPDNFVTIQPGKNHSRLAFRMPRSADIERLLDESGLDSMGYSRRGRYRVRVKSGDVELHRDVLLKLMMQACGPKA